MELKYTAQRSGRLSSFLRLEMAMSAGLVNRLKWQDRLFVNGIPRHTNYAVVPGDEITVPLNEPVPDYPAEPGPLTVLFEDDHLLAVDKPAGMLIHPSRSTLTGTLANRVLAYYRQSGQACAFHPITRLDRDTFGIVLLAKNAYIHNLFTQLPKDAFQKIYHALVWGGPEAEEGWIDAPIARRPLPSLLRYVNPQGKPSLTRYQVLRRGQDRCLLELQPITGRTHQLRVHCAHMGYPILGDPQYCSAASRQTSDGLGLKSQLLCAKTLSFTHPMTRQPLTIHSQITLADTPDGQLQAHLSSDNAL